MLITRKRAGIASGALALGVVAALAVPLSASATHPQVSLSAVCDTTTGENVITAVVSADPGYPDVAGTFVSASRMADQIVGQTVTGGQSITATERLLPNLRSVELTVGIQFTNHASGDVVTNSGSVRLVACEVTPPPVTPVTGIPTVSVTQGTCDNRSTLISYSIPAGLSIAGYTGTGAVTAEALGLAAGDHTYPVDVAVGFSYDGPASVSFTIAELPTVESCTPVPPVDLCPNIDGPQGEIPAGYVVDGEGACVLIPEEPPVDVCPDLEGAQPEGADCTPVVPPTEEPPVEQPPVVTPPTEVPPVPATPASLVTTGSEPTWPLYGSLAFLALGATLVVVTAVRRRVRA